MYLFSHCMATIERSRYVTIPGETAPNYKVSTEEQRAELWTKEVRFETWAGFYAN